MSGRADAIAFLSASQPFAGAFLNAVPLTGVFTMTSDFFLTAVQRRLRAPLSVLHGLSRSATLDAAVDPWGDAYQNAGTHSTRHASVLTAWAHALKHAHGSSRLESEPARYAAYSETRPDIVRKGAVGPGKHILYEIKVVSPITTGRSTSSPRGTTVAFANTVDGLRALIHGAAATATHQRVRGAYAFAKKRGHHVRDVIHETFGGFSPGAAALLHSLAKARDDKIGAHQLSAPWCAQQFTSYHAQRISIAIHTACAEEIHRLAELDVPASVNPDPFDPPHSPTSVTDTHYGGSSPPADSCFDDDCDDDDAL